MKGGFPSTASLEQIVNAPQNDFVKNFILNQLEIKKNNIFTLFKNQLNIQPGKESLVS